MLFPPDLLLPGPTPVPDAVERAMLTPMSDHRGSVFEAVRVRVLAKLAQIFHMNEDDRIAILPASGTGTLEAVCQNFLSPGDRVLAVITGMFGRRFAEAAEAQGLAVDRMEVEWGTAFDVGEVLAKITSHDYHAVLVTHNETSTGVTNPVERLGAALHGATDAPLYLVDSISGVPSLPLFMDQPGIDVILAASQKGFMCPPGLGLVAAGPRALQRLPQDRPGRYYFDLRPYFEGHFPYTPAVSLWYGLDAALDLLLEEGEAPRYARHRLLGQMTRAFGSAGGFPPIVDEASASGTITSLRAPEGVTPQAIRQQAAARGLQIAGGLGPWQATAFRIGHVGAVSPQMLYAGLAVLAHQSAQPEAALEAAFRVWHRATA